MIDKVLYIPGGAGFLHQQYVVNNLSVRPYFLGCVGHYGVTRLLLDSHEFVSCTFFCFVAQVDF